MTETMMVSTTCVFCGKEHLTEVDTLKYYRWKIGESIQNVWPEMTADDRELLVSGTCPQCWEDHMKDPEDD
jgi:hypothetical protein